jgi:hypothetical protein
MMSLYCRIRIDLGGVRWTPLAYEDRILSTFIPGSGKQAFRNRGTGGLLLCTLLL